MQLGIRQGADGNRHNDQMQKLEPQERPGHRLQSRSVPSHERVAESHGVDDCQQPRKNDVGERNRANSDNHHDAPPEEQRRVAATRAHTERRPDPVLGDQARDEQRENETSKHQIRKD